MDPQSFDMNFAPKSYFDDLTLEEKLGSKIKGQIRGEFVQKNIRTQPINPKVFQSGLDQELKSAQSAVHPWMMGGEYLPDLYENETEILPEIVSNNEICFRTPKPKYNSITGASYYA